MGDQDEVLRPARITGTMEQSNTGRIAPWVEEEMATAQLEDKRLNARLGRLLSDLGDRPAASIPAACGGYKEMTAAYRFFDNPKVTYAKVLEPHQAVDAAADGRPAGRAARSGYHGDEPDPSPATGPGGRPVGWGRAPRACSCTRWKPSAPDGTPLGAVSADIWTRDDPTRKRSVQEKARERAKLPIEQKESFRWLLGLRAARETAQDLAQTQVVCIADSDADIHDLFAEPRGSRPVDWLIRASPQPLCGAFGHECRGQAPRASAGRAGPVHPVRSRSANESPRPRAKPALDAWLAPGGLPKSRCERPR